MADRIHAETLGLVIRAVILNNGSVYDPSQADYIHMTIILPDGEVVVRDNDSSPPVVVGQTSGLMKGENGTPRACLEYTMSDMRTQEGPYLVQAFAMDSEGQWPARPYEFQVWGSFLQLPEDL